jgi:long-chain-fatty-acid--CoA ligase ACSBG
VFGQSECTGPHTVSSPGNWKIGTCGRPIQGSITRLDPVNKELCYKGDYRTNANPLLKHQFYVAM